MRIGIFSETYTPYISGLVTSELMLKKGLEKLGNEVYIDDDIIVISYCCCYHSIIIKRM